jgi:hypothetical protein
LSRLSISLSLPPSLPLSLLSLSLADLAVDQGDDGPANG